MGELNQFPTSPGPKLLVAHQISTLLFTFNLTEPWYLAGFDAAQLKFYISISLTVGVAILLSYNVSAVQTSGQSLYDEQSASFPHPAASRVWMMARTTTHGHKDGLGIAKQKSGRSLGLK